MSNTLTIEYADDLLFALGVSEKEFSDEAKLLIAAKLYEMGQTFFRSGGESGGKKPRRIFVFAFAPQCADEQSARGRFARRT